MAGGAVCLAAGCRQAPTRGSAGRACDRPPISKIASGYSLTYGVPSASGIRTRPTRPATTTIVVM